MTPPPFKRKETLDFQFGADPFDPRFVSNTAGRELTDLGLLVEIWSWVQKNHKQNLLPIFNSLEVHLMRKCPDEIKESLITSGESALPSLPSWKRAPLP